MSRPSRNRVDDENANYPPTLSRVHSRPRASQPLASRSHQQPRVHWPDQEQSSRDERLPYARDNGPDTPMWMQLRDLSSSLPPSRPVSGLTREMIQLPSAPAPSTSRRQTCNFGVEGRARRGGTEVASTTRQDTRERQVQRLQAGSQNNTVDVTYHREEVTMLRRRSFGAPEYEVRRYDATMISRHGGEVSRQHMGARLVRDEETGQPDDQWSTTATVGSSGRGRESRRGGPDPENRNERKDRGCRGSSQRR